MTLGALTGSLGVGDVRRWHRLIGGADSATLQQTYAAQKNVRFQYFDVAAKFLIYAPLPYFR